MKRPTMQLGGKRKETLWTIAPLVTAAMLSPSPLTAQSPACGTATLRDVEVVTERVAQATITSVHEKRKKKPGEREAHVYTTPADRQNKKYLVTVRLNDLLYTGESSGNAFWDFDPTRLVINDPIEACVYKDRLHLRRPDGKDYKTKIVRAVRDSKTSSDEPTSRR